MADDVEQTEAKAAMLLDAEIQNIRNKAALVKGVPGECLKCGDHSERLVGGACAPCRDKFKLA